MTRYDKWQALSQAANQHPKQLVQFAVGAPDLPWFQVQAFLLDVIERQIRRARAYVQPAAWNRWADRWLTGEDRTHEHITKVLQEINTHVHMHPAPVAELLAQEAARAALYYPADPQRTIAARARVDGVLLSAYCCASVSPGGVQEEALQQGAWWRQQPNPYKAPKAKNAPHKTAPQPRTGWAARAADRRRGALPNPLEALALGLLLLCCPALLQAQVPRAQPFRWTAGTECPRSVSTPAGMAVRRPLGNGQGRLPNPVRLLQPTAVAPFETAPPTVPRPDNIAHRTVYRKSAQQRRKERRRNG